MSTNPLSAARPRAASTGQNILGWHGFTLTLPDGWVMASYGGERARGSLRIADQDGTRVELVWETPKNSPDLEKSVGNLEKQWEKSAKKKKQEFKLASNPHIVSKSQKQKAQLINFGWKGDSKDKMAAHGWGVAWHCDHCNRVVVAHLVGRGAEPVAVAQKLATQIFSSLECHGSGGWETWQAFGFRVNIPQNFELRVGKLQTGKIELEWEVPHPVDWWTTPKLWGRPTQRLGVQRLSAANLVLLDTDLVSWGKKTIPRNNKKYLFIMDEENSDDNKLSFSGKLWNLRHRFAFGLGKLLPWIPRHQITAQAWRDDVDNKLFFAFFDLDVKNAHVQQDVIESVESHSAQ